MTASDKSTAIIEREYLSPREIVETLKVTRSTAHRWIDAMEARGAHVLRAGKTVRIDKHDFCRLVPDLNTR